jgi:hypothetical protein
MLEHIQLADQVGLDFYGVGEHHTATMPVSSPVAVINAAAAMTERIWLSTTASVLSTDDPIRLDQHLAVASIVSGGRCRPRRPGVQKVTLVVSPQFLIQRGRSAPLASDQPTVDDVLCAADV